MLETIITVVFYVATKCIDQFIKEEGYSRIREFFFPKTRYINRLRALIMDVIERYQSSDPVRYEDKIAFYHSPEVFQTMADHVLFKEKTLGEVLQAIENNEKVQQPEAEHVKVFFDQFFAAVKSDKKLQKAFVEENYKAEIFGISGTLNILNTQVAQVANNVKSIETKIDAIRYDLNINEHPFVTTDYVVAPEEISMVEKLVDNNVLLLSGVSFCGKSQLAKQICRCLMKQGYRYHSGPDIGEADRFLRNENGNHLYLLEDPFGHSIQTGSQQNLRKVEELIRNLAPGNKLVITNRTEVVTSIMGTDGLQYCDLEGHSWIELTGRSREFLLQVWGKISLHLPEDIVELIEKHLKEGAPALLLQVGQLAHLSRRPVESLTKKPLATLLHLAKADSRELSLDIKSRGRESTHLYMALGMVATSSLGVKLEDLAYILADDDHKPGFLKHETFRMYNSKLSSEVRFPLYEKGYVLGEAIRSELNFLVERGYLLLSNNQVYFRHPTYQEAARYLIIQTQVLNIEQTLITLKRALGCLNSKNAAYLASQLTSIHQEALQAEFKKAILEMAYEHADRSIFPSVRDWMLKFLLESMNNMNQEMQDGTFQLINSDLSSSDIFWHDDQPYYSQYERSFFDEDRFDEASARHILGLLDSTEDLSALQLWQAVQLISRPNFPIIELPDEKAIDKILNADETFIRSKVAYLVLKSMPSIDQKILNRIFRDTNPWVVVEAIRGAFFGYPRYTPKQQEQIVPLLRNAVGNRFVIARIQTMLTCFGIDYGLDYVNWNQIEEEDKEVMWQLWGILFPIFLDQMPFTINIGNSGRFGQTLDASAKYLKNTSAGLKVVDSYYKWVDTRLGEGIQLDTYELGVLSYLLDISDNSEQRLPLFSKLLGYPKSSLLLYSLSWAIGAWSQLGQSEKEIIIALLNAERKDVRWIKAVVISRYQLPGELQKAIFGKDVFFQMEAEKILDDLDPQLLLDALEVHVGESHLFSWLGLGHSRSEKWHDLITHILLTGHCSGFKLCLSYFIFDVINGPSHEWGDTYLEIWQAMCGKADLRDDLAEFLILATAHSNPSIESCTALWEGLISACQDAEKVRLARKVVDAIEAMQRHDPTDIFRFFNRDFLNMLLTHFPLDSKIVSVLEAYPEDTTIPIEELEKLGLEVAELSKTEQIRLQVTFDIIREAENQSGGHPSYSVLKQLPDLIGKVAKKWIAEHRLDHEIKGWIE